MIITIYEQNQLIRKYQGLLYMEMEDLRVPVERFLEFHKASESYDSEKRNEILEDLNQDFIDFSMYSGSGLQLEPEMREKYYLKYDATKKQFKETIMRYTEATTLKEREQTYQTLKEQYIEYNDFLTKSYKELVAPLENY